jgi:hypothetical protein
MKRTIIFAVLAGLAASTPARAQSDLEVGFTGALRGCEEWVLNPASQFNGATGFISTVGLGDKMGLADRVEDVQLPPKPFRVANHFWRINSTKGAGYMLVVSDRLPICHITGGGDTDLQPVVSSVLASGAFTSRWKLLKTSSTGDMTTSEFQSLTDPAFSIVISRAGKPGERLDRVQVMATAQFKTGK